MKKMTNLERIKSFTVDALADFLVDVSNAGTPDESSRFCKFFGDEEEINCDLCHVNDDGMKKCIERWLMEEVE